MKTVDQLNAQSENEMVVAMFQVEELEERLENAWTLSGSVEDGPDGTTVKGTATVTF